MTHQIPDRIRLAAAHAAASQAHTRKPSKPDEPEGVDQHDVPEAVARRIAEATLTAIWPQIVEHFATASLSTPSSCRCPDEADWHQVGCPQFNG